ncbi:hypothetical protein BKP37_12825 [Anaerobacillus alkalilacustris]|uniref:Uncharacterized protein n=1 Tax=Anaerobacillus alkalilacustris TaxID=393763 RepID=A0A1S2LKF2_9BACI|nr:hypothetical protein [Anaerobacillus alkalilacustris]OIJ12680.1 hypothetical protein BKP37_12825 [Anaerobacillus alkalilacustris]
MKTRQKIKILKRAGRKLHTYVQLSGLEKRVCNKVADSKLCSALCELRLKEFDAGTIYEKGYTNRMNEVYKKTLTIENVTGVKKEEVFD